MSTAQKPIQCRAAVCWGVGEDLVVENITVDPPKEHEIRIKMVATGICFSDIHGQMGDIPSLGFPVVMGHETTAIVESVGENVTLVKPGDHVIPTWCYQCGKCTICLKGKRNLCLFQATKGFLLDGTTRLTCKGKSLKSGLLVAGFSEYSVVPDDAVYKLDLKVPLDKVAIYGCCVITGYGAAKNTAKVNPGSTVCVIGLGAIGLCAILGARDCKAGKIIGVDVNPDKREIAKAFGMTDFVNPKDHPGKLTSDLIKELSGGLGADFTFICIGKKEVANDALATVIRGGEVIIIAIPEAQEVMEVNSMHLLIGKTLKGSWGGDCFINKDLPVLIKQYMGGTMPTDLLITKVISLGQINEGFNLLKQGKSIRTVIKF